MLYVLTLIVPADVDRTEFEADAIWREMRDGTAVVTQTVRKDGGYFVGPSGAYMEGITEVIGDVQRFAGLIPVRK